MDPILTELLRQGGLAAVAGVALWLLHTTHVRHDAERKSTADTLTKLIESAIAKTESHTAAFVRLCERVEALLTRSGRRAA